MAYQDNVITRVDCKCKNGVRVSYLNNQITQYGLPKDTEKIIYYKENSSSEYNADVVSKDELNEGEKQQKLELCGTEAQKIKIETEIETPVMQYCDVTDTEMFGFKEITKNVLVSPDNGLWAYHGLRKLKFNFKNLQQYADDYTIKANLVFDHRDNDEMLAVSSGVEDVIINTACEKNDNKDYELFIYVNTNKLGEKFEGNYAAKQKMLFSGYVQVEFSIQKHNTVIYVFPVELLINNTNFEACKKIQKNVVSIDFGTSSSCVAVRGEDGVELLTLSASEDSNESVNIYENPTCVMLYRWEEIYQQWKLDNEDFPILLKGNLDEYKLGQKSMQYDFGYSVKNHLKEVDDQQLNSILTEIKMIPKYLSEGKQESVRPLVVKDKKVVNLVDSYEKQNDESFDVIAFYGYILGKAINRVEKNKIYTRFLITYPVKFSSEVREKVKKSLEYGLKRSIPKPLRSALNEKKKTLFDVKMKYPEPVAYIGSVCGKYLKYTSDNYEPQLFGVFDFGGGTLDYSFGIFAKDEDDDTSSNIHVLGVDGDPNVGGELLIKKMAYWLYTADVNRSVFVGKQIPFEKPIGEVLPDGCPEELFNSTADAKSNVRKVCETVTRDIFQGITTQVKNEEGEENSDKAEDLSYTYMRPNMRPKNSVKDEESLKENVEKPDNTVGEKKPVTKAVGNTNDPETISVLINLHDVNGEEVPIEIAVEIKDITAKLTELLEEKVSDFKSAMDRTFENHQEIIVKCGGKGYDSNKVVIFEAGNSSKNAILREQMEKAFPENTKFLVDETDEKFMEDKDKRTKPKKIALTPKTAVAFGQVILSDYYVDDSYIKEGTGDAPFNWYIGNVNRGDNSFTMIIDKANVTREWKRYGRINSEDMKIYYAETPVEDGSNGKLREADVDFVDEDDLHKMLYIRVSGADSIECCVCEKGSEPGENDDVTGEIVLK